MTAKGPWRWGKALAMTAGFAAFIAVAIALTISTDASIARAHQAPPMDAVVDRVEVVDTENDGSYTRYTLTVSDPAHDTHFRSELKDSTYRSDPTLQGKTVAVRVDPEDHGRAVWAQDPDYVPADTREYWFELIVGTVLGYPLMVLVLGRREPAPKGKRSGRTRLSH